MKKFLLTLTLLLCLAPFVRADELTETQNKWAHIIRAKDVAAAKIWAAKPDFDPLLRLPERNATLLAAALEDNLADIGCVLVQSAPNDDYVNTESAVQSLAYKTNLKVLKLFLANPNFDVNQIAFGQPFLARTVGLGNVEGVKLLLADARIEPMKRDYNGKTALFALVYAHSDPIAALLLADKRIDPNAVDEDGNTALHLLADSGDTDVLKRLLDDPRVNPNLKNKKGETPLFRAASSDMKSVKILVANKKVIVGPKEKARIAKLKKSSGNKH